MDYQHQEWIDNLRLIYQEVVEGFSPCKDVYFKHFTDVENIEILRKQKEFFDSLVKEGVPTQKERLKLLIENDDWSKEKDDRIIELRLMISDNEKNLPTILQQMRGGIEKAIQKDREELKKIVHEKYELLGSTADEISQRNANQYQLFLSICKDKRGAKKFSSWEEFESLEQDDLNSLTNDYNETLARITEEKLREISILPLFLQKLSFAKDRFNTFFERSYICDLTSFQINLLSMGQRNYNVLTQSKGNPPELIGATTPREVITWYDQQYSIMLSKLQNSK